MTLIPTATDILGPGALRLGWQEIVAVGTPASAGSHTHKVDSRYVERWLGVRFVLTTDATAGNRTVTVDFTDSEGNVLIRNGAAVLQGPSTVQEYQGSARRSVSEWNPGTPVYFPIQEYLLTGPQRAVINIQGGGAADQLSSIVYVLEHFPTGPALVRELAMLQLEMQRAGETLSP